MKKRPSSARRGYGYKWRKRRAADLRRARKSNGGKNPRCSSCGNRIQGSPHRDHRRPKHRGGRTTGKNLRWVCAKCHGRKTRREA